MTFAEVGVGLAGLLLVSVFLAFTVEMLKSSIGRALVAYWALVFVVAWGALGGLYLLAKAV